MHSILPRTYLLPRARAFAVAAIAACIALATSVDAKSPNGKGKGQAADFVPPGQVDKSVPPGHRRAPIEIVVRKAPPPLRIETISVRPSTKHMWVAGYWVWTNNAYAWTPGGWMLPPEPTAVWVAPRIENRSGVTVSVGGYWKL